MKKLKTSSKSSQKSIEISGCSTQIGIEGNLEFLVQDTVSGGNGQADIGNKFYGKTNQFELKLSTFSCVYPNQYILLDW